MGKSDTPAPDPAGSSAGGSVTAAQVAAHWGTSAAYVYKCFGKGCPKTSLADADTWRLAHSSRGVGYRSKNAPPAPAESPPAKTSAPPRGQKSPAPRELVTLEDSLAAAREIEEAAHQLVVVAQRLKLDAVLPNRIAAYTKAQSGRFEAEKRYREEMERRNVLIEQTVAKAEARRGVEVILNRLASLPKNLAPKVSPDNPGHAEPILRTDLDAIIAEARRVYGIAA